MSLKNLTNHQILTIIKKIKDHLDDGWSIGMARKKASGYTTGTFIDKQIVNHPAYLELLNWYMETRNYGNRYHKTEKGIKANFNVPKTKQNH